MSDIQFIADSILIEKISKMEYGLELQKHGSSLPGDIFSGAYDQISSYVQSKIDTSSTGAFLKSVFDILTPGILFNSFGRVFGLAAAAGNEFGYSPSAVLSSIVASIKPKIMSGQQVTSDDVNRAAMSAGGITATADLLYELREIEKRGELLKTAKAGKGSGVLSSIFSFLISPNKDKSVSAKRKKAGKSIGVGMIAWAVKAVLASAGLLAGGALASSMLKDEEGTDGKEEAEPVSPAPVTPAQVSPPPQTPAKQNGKQDEFTRYVKLIRDPRNTLVQWASSFYPELSGYDSIISNIPSFRKALSVFRKGYQPGKSLVALPPGMREQDIVDMFASDAKARVAKEKGQP